MHKKLSITNSLLLNHSVGSFVIKTRFDFLLVKMDLATNSGSEYDKGKK